MTEVAEHTTNVERLRELLRLERRIERAERQLETLKTHRETLLQSLGPFRAD